MEAMQCLGMPHSPTGGSDRQLSYSSRRNPLRRRPFAFPKGGARVAAPRRWPVCAQAPPPSQPEGKDADPKGRLGGWNRTRGVAVGAAVVLACALGAACLNRAGGAYCCPQTGQCTSVPIESSAAEENISVGKITDVLLGTLELGDAPPPWKPATLLRNVLYQFNIEICSLTPERKNEHLLLAMAVHLYDEMRKEFSCCFPNYSCLGAFPKGYSTTDWFYDQWKELPKGPRKDELGLLLIKIFIRKGDYKKALTICDKVLEEAPKSDARPRLYLAISKIMLAMESVLEKKAAEGDLEKAVKEATDKLKEFQYVRKPNDEEMFQNQMKNPKPHEELGGH